MDDIMTYTNNIESLQADKFYLVPNKYFRNSDTAIYLEKYKENSFKIIIVSTEEFLDYLSNNYLELYNFAFDKIKRNINNRTRFWNIPEDMYRYFELMNTLNGDIFDKLRKIINKEDNYIKWRHFKGMK